MRTGIMILSYRLARRQAFKPECLPEKTVAPVQADGAITLVPPPPAHTAPFTEPVLAGKKYSRLA